LATKRFFADHPQTIQQSVASFAAAFEMVTTREVVYAVVPIENSASGSIPKTYDLLAKAEHDVVICGEMGLREVYCLVANVGVELRTIKNVHSHPNILDACSQFLKKQLPMGGTKPDGIELTAAISTTEAVRRVVNADDKVSVAAIATKEAAVRQNLVVLRENIGDDAWVETRYILIRHRTGPAANVPTPFPSDAKDPAVKQSVCFALPHEAGAVFKLISCLALRNINVLKIETRPLDAAHRGSSGLPLANLWDYLFFIDFVVPTGQTKEASAQVWASLREFSTWQRDLGEYHSYVTSRPKEMPPWEQTVDVLRSAIM